MGESIVSVAGGTEFGRNTDEEHFEHFTALFATDIELGNHLLYGPSREVHQRGYDWGVKSLPPEEIDQQIPGIHDLGVFGFGQYSLFRDLRFLRYRAENLSVKFRFAHIQESL